MADTVKVRWLYPPNWDGFLPDRGGFRSVELLLTNVSDGTGEDGVKKLDISELRTVDDAVPVRTVVESLEWDISGIANVKLEWDRNPRALIEVLSAQGRRDYRKAGGLADPGEAGDRTGDILLTTDTAAAGGSYSIRMKVRLKGS